MFNCWCLNVFSFRFPASGCLQSVSPGTASLSCSCSSWSSPPLPASSGRCQSPWGYWWWPYTSYSLLCRSAYRNVFSQFEQQIFQWKYIPRHTDVQEWKCLFWTFPAFHEALLHSVHLQGKLFALQHLIDYFNWTYLKFIAAPSKSPGNFFRLSRHFLDHLDTSHIIQTHFLDYTDIYKTIQKHFLNYPNIYKIIQKHFLDFSDTF